MEINGDLARYEAVCVCLAQCLERRLVAPDLSIDRYHSICFGCVQRVFRTWFQTAPQDEERQTGKIQTRYGMSCLGSLILY
jgi:hypothetical protein